MTLEDVACSWIEALVDALESVEKADDFECDECLYHQGKAEDFESELARTRSAMRQAIKDIDASIDSMRRES